MKTYFFYSLLDVTVDTLKQLSIRCVLLDIDNTIRRIGASVIESKFADWIDSVKSAGINVILCSNNFKRNVAPIAKSVNCDFISFCLKPSPLGFLRAYFRLSAKHNEIVVIGDQFFTDILGSKLLLLKSFLVEPISLTHEAATVKFRRKLTSAFTNKIKSRDNPYIKGS